MSVENRLIEETKKWMSKLHSLDVKALDEQGKEIIKNAECYINDARYFLENSMLIEAFESVIWAWAWIEIGERLNHLSVRRDA